MFWQNGLWHWHSAQALMDNALNAFIKIRVDETSAQARPQVIKYSLDSSTSFFEWAVHKGWEQKMFYIVEQGGMYKTNGSNKHFQNSYTFHSTLKKKEKKEKENSRFPLGGKKGVVWEYTQQHTCWCHWNSRSITHSTHYNLTAILGKIIHLLHYCYQFDPVKKFAF